MNKQRQTLTLPYRYKKCLIRSELVFPLSLPFSILGSLNHVELALVVLELYSCQDLNSNLWYFGHRGRASDSDVVVSMVLHSVGLETYLFSLSRDGNLRMWSCSRAQCITVADMLNNIADTGRNLTQGGKLLYCHSNHCFFRLTTLGAKQHLKPLNVFFL
jgi:hypothetical protein